MNITLFFIGTIMIACGIITERPSIAIAGFTSVWLSYQEEKAVQEK